jgi:site-specific DNA-methyltransferase (adenine-specific)
MSHIKLVQDIFQISLEKESGSLICKLTDINGKLHNIDFNNFGEHFINIDCMDALRQMPDKCIDLCICDPPYGISINHNMGRRKGDKSSSYKKVTWDDVIPSAEYFNELFRVSKNQIIWGGNYFQLPPNKCFVIWKKPQISEDVSFSMCEYAWASFDSTAKVVELYGQEADRIHPTQKPIKLYEWLLKRYAVKGDKILDTHVGSASSLIACHNLGFDYVGFELDKEYYSMANKRLEDVKAQRTIFDLGVERYSQSVISQEVL